MVGLDLAGGPLLRVVPVQLQVAQLGVGHQDAVGEDGAADAGAEGEQDDRALAAASGAEVGLGDAGRVRVVDDGHRQAAQALAEQGPGVGVDPALVDVGRRTDHRAAGDHAREGESDRAGPAEVLATCRTPSAARDGAERGWLSPLSGDGSQGAFALSAVVGAVSVAVLSYLGFDAIAAFAEEVTGGSAKVARALLFCLALAGVLFVAQTYLAALLAPMSSAELAAAPEGQGSAFYDAVDASVGTWLHDLVAVSKAIGRRSRRAGQAAAGRRCSRWPGRRRRGPAVRTARWRRGRRRAAGRSATCGPRTS
ncbi:hypothetical protein SFUMM280S_03906 [Streptomyces fumanus]